MRPFFAENGIEIFNADSRSALPLLADTRFDAVLADPPFGINFKYDSHDDSPDGYGEFVWSVIRNAETLCNPGSPIFVWQAMANARHFSSWFPRDYRIFAAAKNFVQMRPTAMQYAFDPVLVWWTDGKPWTAGTCNRDFHVANTSGIISQKTHQRAHPCPRPLDQLSYIIGQWVRPGGTILDPFMGSGTTLLAAKQLGRQAIGIEISEQYCAIAVERLKQSVLNFEPEPIQATKQLPLDARTLTS